METDQTSLRRAVRPGTGWLKFGVERLLPPLPRDRTYVETTTVCQAMDGQAWRRFALYWAVIGPFSALTRRDMLAALDRAVR